MARWCIDIDLDVYYCLDKIISQMQLERGGRASRDKIIKEIFESMCKEKSMNK